MWRCENSSEADNQWRTLLSMLTKLVEENYSLLWKPDEMLGERVTFGWSSVLCPTGGGGEGGEGVTPNIEIENIDKVEKYYSTKVFRLTFLARIRLQGGVQEYFKGFFLSVCFFVLFCFVCLFVFVFVFVLCSSLFIYFFRWWIKLNLLC